MSTLRVTAGALRGRRVPVPRDEVRPTSEKARQAFFNIVGPAIIDARFLDLFAGSGIFSFEALSRGAASAVAIDLSRRHTTAIEGLARDFAVEVTAVAGDVLSAVPRLTGPPFDIVYADPPYDYAGYDALVMAIDTRVPLSPGATVAIEHRRGTNPFTSQPARLQHTRRAEYGEVWIDFFIA